MRNERRVGVGIARQDRELDRFSAASRFDFGKPIAPVSGTAEKPQHNQPCVPECLLDVEIDREIVLKVKQIGEPERRPGAFLTATKPFTRRMSYLAMAAATRSSKPFRSLISPISMTKLSKSSWSCCCSPSSS